jgi:glycosyltransferase involved in cell wall biosynthesis
LGEEMKIIQVCPRFFPDIGGIETHVYEISKRLTKDNDVYVYTTDPTGKLPKQETIDGINVLRFRSFAPNEAYFFSPQMYFALKKQSCDILHVHSFHAFPSFLAYCAMNSSNSKKLIFTPHYHPVASTPFRNIMHKLYDPIQAKIFHKSNKVICVSDYEIDLLTRKFNIPKEKLVNIPNGIDIKKFRKLPNYRKENDFQILYVGRLEKYKRVHWILFALNEILEKFPDKKIHLVVVGKGPFEKKLIKLTRVTGLRNFVSFKSNLSRSELEEEYRKCDVFVMPSEYEAFSISTLEALSYGKPVIVSNVGFLSEIARNNGYTIDSKEDLVKSLSLIIENGMKVKFDFKKYSWDNIANQIFKVYVE